MDAGENRGDVEMSYWESPGKTDEWYTPRYIFDAMGVDFDLDPCHPNTDYPMTPVHTYYSMNGLDTPWFGFVWMNPPYGKRNGLIPWLNKFFEHGDGVALVPDRTSAPWCQAALKKCDAALFVGGKIKFIDADGQQGKHPSNGTILVAAGGRGTQALKTARDRNLGTLMEPNQ